MRNLLLILGIFVFIPGLLLGGTPTIDGNFDGTAVWGSPVLTADGSAGWASANAIALYVTYDDNYVYLGANVDAASWMAWAFLINTKPGGGTTDSWSRNIDYAHADPPDYIFRGHFDGYAEFHTWNGVAWDGIGNSMGATEFAENVPDNDLATDKWVECRIPHSSIGNASIGNIQFFITGNQNFHGCFDACPNDDNANDWNYHSSLSNYSSDTPLPVSLQSFSVNIQSDGILVTWVTQSELNNLGFEIYRSTGSDENFSLLASYETNPDLKGLLNSTTGQTYRFLDKSIIVNETYYYKLADVDVNGHRTFHGPLKLQFTNNSGGHTTNVVGHFELLPNYPNPFNPSTKLSIRIGGEHLRQVPTELSIFNALGQKVATIVQAKLAPGVYEFEWDGTDDFGRNMPSGIYFQTLITPQFRSSRPMILMQ
ncbi:MAG: hypothetical protein Kow0037_20960 [Calditrichia bacterium]